MEISRHKRRILLVQAIFLWEGQDKENLTPQQILEYIWDNCSKSTYEASSDEFDQERFFGMIDKIDELRSTITEHAPDWPLEKVASHDRAVLYLGIYELLHTDVPTPVVINEAVELSKAFGGDRSSKFINGVLSSVNKAQSK